MGYYSIGETKDIVSNTKTKICSLELPTGLYVITGWCYLPTSNAHIYSEIKKENETLVSDSGYDSSGYIGTNVGTLISLSETSTIDLYVQCSNSVTNMQGYLRAATL